MATIYKGPIKKFALIKLDDYSTTASTGGMVVEVNSVGTIINDNTDSFVEIPEDYPSTSLEDMFPDLTIDNVNWTIKECPDNCEPGWIMKDKTLEIVDSNSRD